MADVLGGKRSVCVGLWNVTGRWAASPAVREFYQRSLAKGIKPDMVRLTLARKIAAITLTLWKKGANFDIEKLKSQAA